MAVLKRELKEILQRYDIDPQDTSKLWNCHGTLVLYHRAYEIIAAQEGIRFSRPVRQPKRCQVPKMASISCCLTTSCPTATG